ncbi:ras guanine nucleotide exchange factor domain-containing protein [Suillus subaureus]|uniref:Ras guanine nucleotide exchange factor domain-containing protein n=1 Tax=Suillus subaureus TaxID=48587 RepID=A0A9P7JJN8_9AGAM|nr:ras guanine nucleotide exchange factor domain-containing protein [Suillus subaureus]KAG1825958.1 ras guanine nucleotide exchange factor domain-containing protein [Suillus subaureus]
MTTPTTNTSHCLPAIPSLPPIQMPGDTDKNTYLDLGHDPIAPVSASSTSPQASFSSTSSTLVVPRGTPFDTGCSGFSSSISTDPSSQSLRKSVSVDSFAGYDRETSQRTSSSRADRGNTYSTFEVPRTHKQDGLLRSEPTLSQPSIRSRGASVSAVYQSRDSGIEHEREAELFQRLKRPSEGRRGSVKGKDHLRTAPRPGDLNLPPRMPVQVVDDTRRLHSTTSLISLPVCNPALANLTSGRARSDSLGLQTTTISGRNLSIDTLQPSLLSKEIAIAVVGLSGCGKSTFISEDAKAHGASDIEALFASSSGTFSPAPFRYTRHFDWAIPRDFPVVIYELDIAKVLHENLPPVSGVVVCYDAANKTSFSPVEEFLGRIRPLKLSTIVVALKTDLDIVVDPGQSSNLLKNYDVGLVQVDHLGEAGRARIKKVFNWLIVSILPGPHADLRNPASPDVRHSPFTWEARASASAATSTVFSSTTFTQIMSQDQGSSLRHSPTSTLPSSPPPIAISPTRARSTPDLLSTHEMSKLRESSERKLSNARSVTSFVGSSSVNASSFSSFISGRDTSLNVTENGHFDHPVSKDKEPRSGQYATLEELLDKLLFLAVSGDDPTFISHFLLTYRRFASPRSILLAMQKRMRELDNLTGDPMFASYAQMRICHLLETWIRTYPQDFAVPGAPGALHALVRSIVGKTYLLHYGSDFLPFLSHLPNITDTDAAWALKSENPVDESEDPYSISDGEEEALVVEIESPSTSHSSVARSNDNLPSAASVRERKSSLPLSAKIFIPVNSSHNQGDAQDMSPKDLLNKLRSNAQTLATFDCSAIAEEITRVEAKLFMDIEPRHWLQYTLMPGRKDPELDSISRFNAISNHLADWVVSLILCHDKPRHRARQIERFVDIAHELRALNNYSALRAFVAGINNSTFQGDETMEIFKNKTPDHYKNLLSWDVLLQHRGAHQAYRMALKNTKGACIPALEVHMSDLIRAHEGNPNVNLEDPTKIHWGKFNMFGRFIQTTSHCQIQCQTNPDYCLPSRDRILKVIFNEYVMSEDMQTSRMAPLPDSDLVEEPFRSTLPRTMSREHSTSSQRDATILRRILQR